jgi:hypothetical protein
MAVGDWLLNKELHATGDGCCQLAGLGGRQTGRQAGGQTGRREGGQAAGEDER